MFITRSFFMNERLYLSVLYFVFIIEAGLIAPLKSEDSIVEVDMGATLPLAMRSFCEAKEPSVASAETSKASEYNAPPNLEIFLFKFCQRRRLDF